MFVFSSFAMSEAIHDQSLGAKASKRTMSQLSKMPKHSFGVGTASCWPLCSTVQSFSVDVDLLSLIDCIMLAMHWTLLALHSDANSRTLRYYDSLDGQSEDFAAAFLRSA